MSGFCRDSHVLRFCHGDMATGGGEVYQIRADFFHILRLDQKLDCYFVQISAGAARRPSLRIQFSTVPSMV